MGIDEYDRSTVSRKALVKFLKGRYGSTSYEISQGEIRISCSDKNISISEKSITWERYVALLDQYCPKEEKEEPELVERREEQRDMVPEIETEETDCKEPAGKSDREISVPMDELVEEGREEISRINPSGIYEFFRYKRGFQLYQPLPFRRDPAVSCID